MKNIKAFVTAIVLVIIVAFLSLVLVDRNNREKEEEARYEETEEEFSPERYETDTEGLLIVPYDDVVRNYGMFEGVIDPLTGDYMAQADGFYAGGTYIDFDELRQYDGICDALAKINETVALNTSDTICLMNPYNNSAESFSAEIEEQLREEDTDSVKLTFIAENIDDAVNLTLRFDGNRLLSSMSLRLLGDKDFTKNGITLVFRDYGINVISNGEDYSFGWVEEE